MTETILLKKLQEDPFSLLGQRFKSRHCKGKQEKVIKFFPSRGNNEVISHCGCGAAVFTDATGIRGCYEKVWFEEMNKYLTRPRLRENIKIVKSLFGQYASVAYQNRRVETAQDFFNHGWFLKSDFRRVSKKLYKEIYPKST